MDSRTGLGILCAVLLINTGCSSLGGGWLGGEDRIEPVEEDHLLTPPVVSNKLPKPPQAKPETIVMLARTREEAADLPNRTPAQRERLLEQARIRYQQALDMDPNNLLALMGLGNLYLKLNDRQRALAMYEHATRTHPQKVEVWYQYAMVKAKLGDWNGATASLGQALQLDSENRRCIKALGFCQLSNGQIDQGYRTLRRVMNEAETRYNMAQALYHMQRDAESEAQLRLALRADPHHAPAREMMARFEPVSPAPGNARPIRQTDHRGSTHPSAYPPNPQPIGEMPTLHRVTQESPTAPAPLPVSSAGPEPILTTDWSDPPFTQGLPPAEKESEQLLPATVEMPKIHLSLHPKGE